jgi:hypothetical protein
MRVLLAVGIFLLAASPVRAELPRLESAEARAHLQKGLDLYRAKSYGEAAREIERAYTLEPRPELLYTWAQALRLGGDCTAAIPLYERFLATTRPADEAGRAGKNLARCREQLPPAASPEPGPPAPAAPPAAPPAPALPSAATPPLAGPVPRDGPAQDAASRAPPSPVASTAAGLRAPPTAQTMAPPPPAVAPPKIPSLAAPLPPPPGPPRPPWTEDGVGHLLLAGGLVSAAGTAGLYFWALDTRQAARASVVYGDAFERARATELRRNLAYGAGGLAVTLVAAAAVRYMFE